MPRKPPPKPPSKRPRSDPASDEVTISKLSGLITAQQGDIDRLEEEVSRLRLANKGLVALLATAVCSSCEDGFYDEVDMQTGEVWKRPCPHCL
ncbi:MAG: hypothetical protein OT477_16090 [Chloroflexi bacterium]|nr:hypothetical protein [Chloroflexota bacterium]